MLELGELQRCQVQDRNLRDARDPIRPVGVDEYHPTPGQRCRHPDGVSGIAANERLGIAPLLRDAIEPAFDVHVVDEPVIAPCGPRK